MSGFSPLSWGSRGVALGSDLPHADWEKQIEHSLATFESYPMILQKFHKGALFGHPYWDSDLGQLRTMKGRVRLCPYYFVESDRVRLRGALATVAPADKKFLHGMTTFCSHRKRNCENGTVFFSVTAFLGSNRGDPG